MTLNKKFKQRRKWLTNSTLQCWENRLNSYQIFPSFPPDYKALIKIILTCMQLVLEDEPLIMSYICRES